MFFQKLSESISHQNTLSAQQTEHCEAGLGGKTCVPPAWIYGIWNSLICEYSISKNSDPAH